MSGANLNSNWLTFEGNVSLNGNFELSHIRFHGRDYDQNLSVGSTERARTLMNRAIVDHCVDVVSRFLVSNSDGRVAKNNYYANVQGLVLEDFFARKSEDGHTILRFRVTGGAMANLFHTVPNEKTLDSLADVFIPLTNLASYLRAMNEAPVPARQAVDLTADRIDEFLLAFGRRLRDPDEGMSHHSLKA